MGITRGFFEHGYKHSIFSEAWNFLSCWGGNQPLIDGIGVSAYENACNTANRLHARNRCRRSCRTIAAVLSGHVSHNFSRRTRSRAFRFHFNIILKSDLGFSSGLLFQYFQVKCLSNSLPHMCHMSCFSA